MILVVAGLALAMGVGSALLPLINAEAYALVTAAGATSLTVAAVVVALSVGQTMGKVVLFETARRGSGRLAPRANRWTERVGGWLRSDRTGPPVVLAAAVVGIPPLAIVSVVAGAAGLGSPSSCCRSSRWVDELGFSRASVPPSTTSVAPTTSEAASESRKAMTAATSSGRPGRPIALG